jgi:hypothetical protein
MFARSVFGGSVPTSREFFGVADLNRTDIGDAVESPVEKASSVLMPNYANTEGYSAQHVQPYGDSLLRLLRQISRTTYRAPLACRRERSCLSATDAHVSISAGDLAKVGP